MCQRPKRAFFISTQTKVLSAEEDVNCVNALNGLSSFLRDGYDLMSDIVLFLCQRPKRAFFISTNKCVKTEYGKSIWCQRPKRAFFISTATLALTLTMTTIVSTP